MLTPPTSEELSAYLADQGLTGRGGTSVSPSTLRRYLPEFRSYSAWRQYLDDEGEAPTAEVLSGMPAGQGFTAAADGPAKLKTMLDDFPRRGAALGRDWADTTA